MPFLPNLYKLAALAALAALIAAQWLSPLTSATVGVAVLYALLARFT
jgi:hypothetical protein